MQDLHDYLRLLHASDLDLGVVLALLKQHSTPGDAVESLIRAGPDKNYRSKKFNQVAVALSSQGVLADAASDLRWTEKSDCGFLSRSHRLYPGLLKEIDTNPYGLFYQGDLNLLEMPCISVVGTRYPTAYGRRVTQLLAGDLSEYGFLIVSGMAKGVDSLAHEAALGRGLATIAVLGCGCDVAYPRENLQLHQAIATQGLILSEYPPGTLPRPAHFPLRNRIVTGLTPGVVVVEARMRSGSLISARLSMEQGREVFAVPGSIFSKQSEGCLRLIRDGAKLTSSLADVLEEMGASLQPEPRRRNGEFNEIQQMLLNLLDLEAKSLEFLATCTHLNVNEVMSNLVELEIRGLVRSIAGGYLLAEDWK